MHYTILGLKKGLAEFGQLFEELNKGRKHVQCVAAAVLYRVYIIGILRSKYNCVEIFYFENIEMLHCLGTFVYRYYLS